MLFNLLTFKLDHECRNGLTAVHLQCYWNSSKILQLEMKNEDPQVSRHRKCKVNSPINT